MCSINDTEDIVIEKREKFPRGEQKCMKCRNELSVVVIRTNDPLCRDCFMAYCVHKFRMTFGKSRVIGDQEKVLVAYSGGMSSAALVHLIQEGKSERAKRPLRFIPKLVYISEGAIVEESVDDEQRVFFNVVEEMKKTNLGFAAYAISQVFSDSLQPLCTNVSELSDKVLNLDISKPDAEQKNRSTNIFQHHISFRSKLRELLYSTTSLTAKQRLVAQLRSCLLSRIASMHGVEKILLGDNGTQLAVRMLANITQGAGAQLSYDTGFVDNRRKDAIFLRPMKGFTCKEIAFYGALNNVRTITTTNLSTKAGAGSSLQRLTEDFITGLQQNFPNTVYTVLRGRDRRAIVTFQSVVGLVSNGFTLHTITAEKLDISTNPDVGQGDVCVMCQAPLDTDVGESSALSATVFSQKLCNSRARGEPSASCRQSFCAESACAAGTNQNAGTPEQCCGEGDGSCATSKTSLTRADLAAGLCYSCRLLLNDLKDVEKLPSPVLEEAVKHMRRNKMRTEIADFLLDDNS